MKIYGNITGRMTKFVPNLQPNKKPLGIYMLETDFTKLEERVAAYYVRDNNEMARSSEEPSSRTNS